MIGLDKPGGYEEETLNLTSKRTLDTRSREDVWNINRAPDGDQHSTLIAVAAATDPVSRIPRILLPCADFYPLPRLSIERCFHGVASPTDRRACPGRRAFLGGGARSPLAQVFGLFVFEIIAFLLFIKLRPYESRRNSVIAIWMLGACKVITSGLSIAFLPHFAIGRILSTVFGIIIIVVH